MSIFDNYLTESLNESRRVWITDDPQVAVLQEENKRLKQSLEHIGSFAQRMVTSMGAHKQQKSQVQIMQMIATLALTAVQ